MRLFVGLYALRPSILVVLIGPRAAMLGAGGVPNVVPVLRWLERFLI